MWEGGAAHTCPRRLLAPLEVPLFHTAELKARNGGLTCFWKIVVHSLGTGMKYGCVHCFRDEKLHAEISVIPFEGLISVGT